MLITDHLKDNRRDTGDTARHPVRPTEPRVLIADDQADVLEALRLLLKAEGPDGLSRADRGKLLPERDPIEPGGWTGESRPNLSKKSRIHRSD